QCPEYEPNGAIHCDTFAGPTNECIMIGKTSLLEKGPGLMNDGLCVVTYGKFQTTPEMMAEVANTWFEAYLKPIDGLPDADIVQRAESFPLPLIAHESIKRAVHNALDRILGFDIRLNSIELAGISSPLNPTAAALVSATRDGFTAALRDQNPDKVVEPLETFWREHPDFKPMHSGRCYPHGHKGVTYH